MVEKRKATTRAKGEAPAKRRASAQIIEESKETPAPEAVAVEAVTNSLPTKLSDGKPLPTLDEPQPLDLSNKEYQSIAQRFAPPHACPQVRMLIRLPVEF